MSRIRQWIEGTANAVGTTNESNRMQWLTTELGRIPPGARLLDAGAGEQRFRPLCSHLRYVAQDFAKYDGTGDQRGLQTGSWDQTKLDLVCDITAIPEPDGSFDAILCVEVFEHLPEPVLAIREFARLLHPGGVLLLTAPFCSLTHFAPFHFSTGFSRYFYEHHLAAEGFRIEDMTPNGNYFEYLAQELRRLVEVSNRYAGQGLSSLEKAATALLLRALRRRSERDRGSSELLAYGFHVRARRR